MGGKFLEPVSHAGPNGSPTQPPSLARLSSPRPGEPTRPALVSEAVPAVEQLLCGKPVVWHVGRAPANQIVGHGQRAEKSGVGENHAAEAAAVRAAPIYTRRDRHSALRARTSARSARRRSQSVCEEGAGEGWHAHITTHTAREVGLFSFSAPSRRTVARPNERTRFCFHCPASLLPNKEALFTNMLKRRACHS